MTRLFFSPPHIRHSLHVLVFLAIYGMYKKITLPEGIHFSQAGAFGMQNYLIAGDYLRR